jgi:predicted dehydrogenase
MNRKLRMGMVGGGPDAFIGAVHRMAANLDGQIELVAGCFSSDPEKSRLSGGDLFLSPERVYSSYEEMAVQEAALPDTDRIDFVSVVTPNHMHAPVATAFLRQGIHVVCDKPMTTTLAEAQALKAEVEKSGCLFALTHNYTGYPMVKQARDLVREGVLGKVLKIVVEYPQGWLLDAIESDGQKQASWRTDPARAGISCCIGDIGSHAENLARYISGLEIESLCAVFNSFVPGRLLEDDGNLLVSYCGGATGILYASQISAGEENNLRIRVYGEKASLAWLQEHPNELTVHPKGEPAQIWRRGNDYVGDSAKNFTRLPFGHPEAFIEAFANIYLEVARHLRDRLDGKTEESYDYPDIHDGLEGMAFIETAVASAASDRKWTPMVRV